MSPCGSNFGMRKISDLGRTLAAGNKIPEDLLVNVGGAYLYYCRVTHGAFDSGILSRIGLIFVVPIAGDDTGAEVDLYGLRLASSRNGEDYQPDSLSWGGHGVYAVHGEKVEVEYILSDRLGMRWAIERVQPVGDSGDWEGEFQATSGDGLEIRGRVEHIRLENRAKRRREFDGLPIRFSTFLTAELRATWGRRLYNLLPQEERTTDELPFVLIDIVTGNYERSDGQGKGAAANRLLARNPSPVLYVAQHVTPSMTLGRGQVQ